MVLTVSPWNSPVPNTFAPFSSQNICFLSGFGRYFLDLGWAVSINDSSCTKPKSIVPCHVLWWMCSISSVWYTNWELPVWEPASKTQNVHRIHTSLFLFQCGIGTPCLVKCLIEIWIYSCLYSRVCLFKSLTHCDFTVWNIPHTGAVFKLIQKLVYHLAILYLTKDKVKGSKKSLYTLVFVMRSH